MQKSTARFALVTGANKGIGFEIARKLGEAGCTVIIGSRDGARGDEAVAKLQSEGLQASTIVLDLLTPESIARSVETIETRFGQLDILVNNAGIAVPRDGPPSSADLSAVVTALQTNFLGAVAVTQAMLPLLRKSSSARIVNVSSGLGSIAQNGDPEWEYAAVKVLGYSASKAALNMFTAQLAYELRETKIKVNAADPGYTSTGLNGFRGHQTIEQGAAEAVKLALLPEDGPTGTFSDSKGPVPW